MCRPVFRLRTAVVTALLAVCYATSAADGPVSGPAQDGSNLRWKLKPGQVLQYRIEEEARLGTEERGLKAKLLMETTWTVDDSRTQFAVKVDRIRFTSSGDVGNGPFEVVYDSADKTAKGQGAKALAALFDTIVGSVAQIKMERHGGLTGLELSKEVNNRFGERAAAELAGFFGETVSPVGLTRRLALVGVPLPDKEVSSGQIWKQGYTFNLGRGPLKSISGVATYGYFVVDGDENKPIATIRTQAEETLNVEGVDRPDVPKTRVTGIIHFDRSSGSLLKRVSTRKHGSFMEITTSVERTDPKQ
jgi:hypothetical protein